MTSTTRSAPTMGGPVEGLPPRTSEMTLASADMFMPDRPEEFEQYPGARVRDLKHLLTLSGNTVVARIIRSHPETAIGASPWHMHNVGVHLGYLTRGWVKMEFEGLGEITLEAGSFWYQPPRNRHRELEMSADAEALEIQLPGLSTSTFFIYDAASGNYRTLEMKDTDVDDVLAQVAG